LAIDWARANGKLILSNDGLADSIDGVNASMNAGAQGWEDFKKTGLEAAEYAKNFILAAWEDLDMANKSQVEQLEFQTWAWNRFGDTFIQNANDIINSPLGPAGLDWYTKLILEWAEAYGFVTKEADGTYKAIEQLGDAAKKAVDPFAAAKTAAGRAMDVPGIDARGMAAQLIGLTGASGIGNITMHKKIASAWESFYRSGMGNVRDFKKIVFGPVADSMRNGEFRFFNDAFREFISSAAGEGTGAISNVIETELRTAIRVAEENPIVAKVEIDLSASLNQASIESFVRNRIIPEINRQLGNRTTTIGPDRSPSTTTRNFDPTTVEFPTYSSSPTPRATSRSVGGRR
jgi:hypothetical protein